MSGDRKGHYLKPGKRASAPGVLFALTVETYNLDTERSGSVQVNHFKRAHLTRTIFRRGRWGNVVRCTCDTPDDTLRTIEALAESGRTNWVVTPHLGDTLTLLRWWDDIEDKGCVWCRSESDGSVDAPVDGGGTSYLLDTLVIRSSFALAQWRRCGTRFRWVDCANYLPSGLNSPRLSGDAPHDAGERGSAVHARPGSTARTPADELADAFTRLCEWWRQVARAPFGTSLGQLSVGLLRSHIPPKSLCTHSDADAHRLERSASFGGRASVWYLGSVGDGDGRANIGSDAKRGQIDRRVSGGVTHYDVRSMYPTLLRDMAFPVKLKSYRDNVSPSEPVELAASYGVIARVTIETDVPEYPYRAGAFVTYPIGRFTTNLTGAELLALKSHGRIVACHSMAVYQMGRPFAGAASAMLDMRQEAREAGDHDREQWVKLVSNSLAGKLAQRQGGWRRVPELDTPGKWGEEYELPADGGHAIRLRYLAGMCWMWCEDRDGRGPYTFAFAYLAAYGRLAMRRIREALPERTVVSQDTDGLWVLSHGVPYLDEMVASGRGLPGHLRRVGHATHARWYTPRHYYTDGKWTLAGFSSPVVDASHGTITDTFAPGIWGARHTGTPDGAVTITRSSLLPTEVHGGDVTRDGWVVPSRARKKK